MNTLLDSRIEPTAQRQGSWFGVDVAGTADEIRSCINAIEIKGGELRVRVHNDIPGRIHAHFEIYGGMSIYSLKLVLDAHDVTTLAESTGFA